ncbi:MAG: hypothetical protein ABIK89_06070 [Planctomycetota bacterium]
MSTNHAAWLFAGIVLAIALSGCAPVYHAYPDACIPYAYCPRSPLPYTTYANCHCPTSIEAEHFWRHGEISSEPVPDSAGLPEDPAASFR